MGTSTKGGTYNEISFVAVLGTAHIIHHTPNLETMKHKHRPSKQFLVTYFACLFFFLTPDLATWRLRYTALSLARAGLVRSGL